MFVKRKDTWNRDKNNNTVHEWDILENKENWNIVEVYYNPVDNSYIPTKKSGWYECWEIIWNIYDNPELKKKK